MNAEANILRQKIKSTIQSLIPAPGEKIALLDFPGHPNVGDSAIWLGEYLFLRENGYENNLYLGEISTYSKSELSEFIGEGTILLHGGGNLGDLWPMHQLFREQIISDFPENRIIQLPQSVWFLDNSNLERARTTFEQHKNLTILARDRASFEIITGQLNTRTLLCPDMAFYLGPMDIEADRTIPCVWLSREDGEGRPGLERLSREGVSMYSWMTDELTPTIRENVILHHQYSTRPDMDTSSALRAQMRNLFPQLAKERVLRGCVGLGRGQRVITERLHGHILCMLMNIPHCILDTRYGKTRNFVDTWDYDSPLINWCETEAEALDFASR